MAFRVGQKVVCVDDANNNWRDWPDCSFPVQGSIYTIRDIGPSYHCGDHACLRLDEIRNPLFNGIEPNFRASRFRPVVERKTDISIFTAMLNPSKQTVDAQ